MKNKAVIIVAAILLVGGAGALLLTTRNNTSSQSAHESDGHSHDAEELANLGELVDLTSQSTVTMDIKDFAYTKPNIKIKKGTRVTWTNRDGDQHNVMKEHEDSDTAHEAPAAKDVKPDVFAGPMLATGESYSFTFNESGVVPYHCAPHPYMKGAVTVVD